MQINELFKNIAHNMKEAGVDPPKDPVLTVNQIIETCSDDIDPIEFEHLLDKTISYNIYLKSRKGSLEAQLIIKEAEFKRLLYLETQNLPRINEQGSYLTKEEKESLVISGRLNGLYKEVQQLKAEFLRIKDVPYAIDRKIELWKLKYRRLMYDREKSGSETTRTSTQESR